MTWHGRFQIQITVSWAGLSRVNVQTLGLSPQKHHSSFLLIILGWSCGMALKAGAAPDCSLSMRTSAPHRCWNDFLSPVAACCCSCQMNTSSYRLMGFTSLNIKPATQTCPRLKGESCNNETQNLTYSIQNLCKTSLKCTWEGQTGGTF